MGLLSRLTLDGDGVTKLVHALTESEHVNEAVVLSTCNRTEVYTAVSRFHGGLGDVTSELSAVTGVPVSELQDGCSVFYDEAAVSHCFQMTSGLDSMVVGEHQILGQVRQALNLCQQAGTVGTMLNALFQQALRVAKRVQSETAAGSAGRSLVTASLDQLDACGVPLEGREVLVVGAGSMAALAAHTAADRGAQITLVNRTLLKAERLAAAVGGTARPMDELDEAMRTADVLISCTGARALVIGPERIEPTPIRGVIDLALPADIHPTVGDLPNVELVNLDRLSRLPSATGEAEIQVATDLVLDEVKDFLGLRRAASVAPTVVALRTMANEVVNSEMARLDQRLPDLGAKERDEVAQTVHRVVEKLLHQPTVRVKELASLPNSPDYAAALRELFALDSTSISAVAGARTEK